MIPMILIIMSVMEMYVIVLLCQLVLTKLKVEFPGNFHIATHALKSKTRIDCGRGDVWRLYLI